MPNKSPKSNGKNLKTIPGINLITTIKIRSCVIRTNFQLISISINNFQLLPITLNYLPITLNYYQ